MRTQIFQVCVFLAVLLVYTTEAFVGRNGLFHFQWRHFSDLATSPVDCIDRGTVGFSEQDSQYLRRVVRFRLTAGAAPPAATMRTKAPGCLHILPLQIRDFGTITH